MPMEGQKTHSAGRSVLCKSRRRPAGTGRQEVDVSLGQYFQWQDLFMVVDDGTIPLSRYAPIEVAIREQGKQFPQGVAILVILPPGARPPPDEVKRHVKGVLTRVASSISCLTYVIEG